MRTGWLDDGPDEAPGMPLSSMLLAQQARGPGDTLALAQARSQAAEAREARDKAAHVRDPDEAAANLISRGYQPGLMSGLMAKLRDTADELESERAKIAAGERRQEHVRSLLERGQVGGLAAAQMMDGDFGDAHRAEQLEHRAERLRARIADVSQLTAPPERRQLDMAEQATQRARGILAQVAEQRRLEDEAEERARVAMRAERAAFRAARAGSRPFSRGGGAAGDAQVSYR